MDDKLNNVEIPIKGKNRKRKTNTEISCNLCSTTCNGEASYAIHLAGQKHRKKENLAKAGAINVGILNESLVAIHADQIDPEDARSFQDKQQHFKEVFAKSLVDKQKVHDGHKDMKDNPGNGEVCMDQKHTIIDSINQPDSLSNCQPTSESFNQLKTQATTQPTLQFSVSKDPLYCGVCHIRVGCLQHLENHMKGSKHAKKVNLMAGGVKATAKSTQPDNNGTTNAVVNEDNNEDTKKKEENEDYSMLLGSQFMKENEVAKGWYNCELCAKYPLNRAHIILHLKGRKHRSNYRKKIDQSMPMSPKSLQRSLKVKELRKMKKENKEKFWKATQQTKEIDTEQTQPQLEEPQLEEPQLEEPQLEEPQLEEPQLEEPQLEEPQLEELKMEQSQLEDLQLQQPELEEIQLHQPQLEELELQQYSDDISINENVCASDNSSQMFGSISNTNIY